MGAGDLTDVDYIDVNDGAKIGFGTSGTHDGVYQEFDETNDILHIKDGDLDLNDNDIQNVQFVWMKTGGGSIGYNSGPYISISDTLSRTSVNNADLWINNAQDLKIFGGKAYIRCAGDDD